MELATQHHRFALKSPFRIARGTKTHADVVRVFLFKDGVTGRGECVPYGRYGDTIESVTAQIEAISPKLATGISRAELLEIMPAGAARNGVDGALWDLEAKLSGKTIWEIANVRPPAFLQTYITIVIDEPGAMAKAAQAAIGFTRLKIKLGGPQDIEGLKAVVAARPDARFIVDANEGLLMDDLPILIDHAQEWRIDMIEQPFAEGKDGALAHIAPPVTLCADESFHTAENIEYIVSHYDAVNIKLDKTGGLTAALDTIKAARAAGLKIMLGCMVGSSLVTAQAYVAACLADWVDLDGPLLLAEDDDAPLSYDGEKIYPPQPALWG